MRIEQLMSRPVHTCSSGETLNEAAHKMWEHDCGALPILGDNGEVVSMITDRDICMAGYMQGRRLSEIPIQEAMAAHVYRCRPDDSLEQVEGVMRANQIRRVPVVDEENHLIGIVSLNDLARHARLSRRGDAVSDELVETFAAICEPRHQTMQSSKWFATPMPRVTA